MHNRMHLTLLLTLALLVALAGAGPTAAGAQTRERCFPETGQCISGPIRAFWERNGGLAVFGYPLGPQQELTIDGKPVQAQWFERQRLELHPENPAPYTVLLGRLGVERLAQQGRDWQSFPPFDKSRGDAERCAFFRETQHQVCDQFLTAFRSNGLSFPRTPGITRAESVALFGLPISEAMTETIDGKPVQVQWFERARFELHPENPAASAVLFGRLGAELQGGASAASGLERGPWQLVSFGPVAAPVSAVAGSAATLTFDGKLVSGSTGCNRFSGGYRATADSITFEPLAATLMACAEEPVNQQEQAIFTALQGQVSYRITGGQLQITYDGGRQALIYR